MIITVNIYEVFLLFIVVMVRNGNYSRQIKTLPTRNIYDIFSSSSYVHANAQAHTCVLSRMGMFMWCNPNILTRTKLKI